MSLEFIYILWLYQQLDLSHSPFDDYSKNNISFGTEGEILFNSIILRYNNSLAQEERRLGYIQVPAQLPLYSTNNSDLPPIGKFSTKTKYPFPD